MDIRMDWDLEQQAIDKMAEHEALMVLCECLIAQLNKELGGE